MSARPFGAPAPLPDWLTIRRGQPGDLLNLSGLEPAAKARWWGVIRTHRPALAELLREPNFLALREAFNADVCVHLEDVRGLD